MGDQQPDVLPSVTVLSDLLDAGFAASDATHRLAGSDSAVSCGDQSVSWGELQQKVAQLSAALLHFGVNPGDRVGIYLHKSIESVVAIHGILRAGAAYVPLDPLAPETITAGIIKDCGITVLVAHEPTAARATTIATAVIGTTSDTGSATSHMTWDEVSRLEPAGKQPVQPSDLAYIMYTSGSTGPPKGIMHTHFSGCAYAKNAVELYGLSATDRMANFSPLHFDMSTLELFAGIGVGAHIVLVPEPYLKLPASLSQLLSDERCTTLYTVPSLFQQLLERGALADRDFSCVRWVLPAGEVFPIEPLRKLMAYFPEATYSNVYGPAEVNQCSFYNFDTPTDLPTDGPLPIGAPTPNTAFRVVNDEGRSVPVGTQGELEVPPKQ